MMKRSIIEMQDVDSNKSVNLLLQTVNVSTHYRGDSTDTALLHSTVVASLSTVATRHSTMATRHGTVAATHATVAAS
jgi:hypothetical protein